MEIPAAAGLWSPAAAGLEVEWPQLPQLRGQDGAQAGHVAQKRVQRVRMPKFMGYSSLRDERKSLKVGGIAVTCCTAASHSSEISTAPRRGRAEGSGEGAGNC